MSSDTDSKVQGVNHSADLSVDGCLEGEFDQRAELRLDLRNKCAPPLMMRWFLTCILEEFIVQAVRILVGAVSRVLGQWMTPQSWRAALGSCSHGRVKLNFAATSHEMKSFLGLDMKGACSQHHSNQS